LIIAVLAGFIRLSGSKGLNIRHKERLRRFRERRSFGFSDGKRMGRWYFVRVFLLLAATALLTWYAKTGVNPFAVDRSIRVYGDSGGYTVTATAAEFRKDTVISGRVTVSGGTLGGLPSADSFGMGAAWREVCPFADSAGRAALLTYGGMTALICDTALFAKLRDGAGVRAPFYEKLDILAVPPSSGEELLTARNRFRPRFAVAAPPCSSAPAKNIICAKPGETGRWRYDFRIKGGKLEVSGDQ